MARPDHSGGGFAHQRARCDSGLVWAGEASDLQETVHMGSRWTGGKMVLQPANPAHKSKDVPIDNFFNKIVMLRDRLRVMEQRVNASENLSDEEKINLQQYITRIYGSLTTFNVLFRDEENHFVGEGGK